MPISFINPLLLWGTLGIAIPIVIHLLSRYRHREIDWAAMELLRRAMVARSTEIRIEDLVILLLRCTAVLLIALAMARPTLKRTSAVGFGREAQVGVVLALDASYSTAHRPGVSTRFDRVVQRAREIIKTLDAGNPVTLVLMGKEPRIVLRNVGFDAERLGRELGDARPLAEPLDIERCLEDLETLTQELKAPTRECYLITDAQASTWAEISDKARASIRNLGESGKVLMIAAASSSAENVAITHFALASGTLRKGSMARCVAEVRNFGLRAAERVAVSLLLDGKPVDQRTLDRIPAGEHAAAPLFARLERTGSAKLEVQLGPDPLRTDNSRSLVACVRDEVRVLCVDGDPSDQPFEGETAFITTALAPTRGGTGESPVEVRTVSWLDLRSQRLGDYHVILLANLPDISAAQVKALHSFVRGGGGLMVFLGDKVIPRLLNARMVHDGEALLPGVLEPLVAPRGSAGTPVELITAGHPLAVPLAALPPELINMARVHRFFRIRLSSGGRAILGLAGVDTPLLSERPLGRGKVLLFASTADRAWTNVMVHPLGPILLHQAVAYLTRQAHEQPFMVGESVALTLPGRTDQTNVVLKDPSGAESRIQVTERDGEQIVELPASRDPGFHEVTFAPRKPPLVFAANVDSTESDVKCLSHQALEKALSGLAVRLLADEQDIAAAIRESRMGRELWRELLILALIVLLAEAFLAHYFSTRITAAADKQGIDAEDLVLAPESTDRESAA